MSTIQSIKLDGISIPQYLRVFNNNSYPISEDSVLNNILQSSFPYMTSVKRKASNKFDSSTQTLKDLIYEDIKSSPLPQVLRLANKNREWRKFWKDYIVPAIEDLGEDYLTDPKRILDTINSIPTKSSVEDLSDEQKRAIITDRRTFNRFKNNVSNNLSNGFIKIDNLDLSGDGLSNGIDDEAKKSIIDFLQNSDTTSDIDDYTDILSNLDKQISADSIKNGGSRDVIVKTNLLTPYFPYIKKAISNVEKYFGDTTKPLSFDSEKVNVTSVPWFGAAMKRILGDEAFEEWNKVSAPFGRNMALDFNEFSDSYIEDYESTGGDTSGNKFREWNNFLDKYDLKGKGEEIGKKLDQSPERKEYIERSRAISKYYKELIGLLKNFEQLSGRDIRKGSNKQVGKGVNYGTVGLHVRENVKSKVDYSLEDIRKNSLVDTNLYSYITVPASMDSSEVKRNLENPVKAQRFIDNAIAKHATRKEGDIKKGYPSELEAITRTFFQAISTIPKELRKLSFNVFSDNKDRKDDIENVSYNKGVSNIKEEKAPMNISFGPKLAYALNVRDKKSPVHLRDKLVGMSAERPESILKQLELPKGIENLFGVNKQGERVTKYPIIQKLPIKDIKLDKDDPFDVEISTNRDRDIFDYNSKKAILPMSIFLSPETRRESGITDNAKKNILKLASDNLKDIDSKKKTEFKRGVMDTLWKKTNVNRRLKDSVYVADSVIKAVDANDPELIQSYFRLEDDNILGMAPDLKDKTGKARRLRYEHVVPMNVMAYTISELYKEYLEENEDNLEQDGTLPDDVFDDFIDTAVAITEELYTIAWVDTRDDNKIETLGFSSMVADDLDVKQVIDAVRDALKNGDGELSDSQRSKISSFIGDRYDRVDLPVTKVSEWFNDFDEKEINIPAKMLTSPKYRKDRVDESKTPKLTNMLFGYYG